LPHNPKTNLQKILRRQRLLQHEILMYQSVMEGLRKGLKFESLLKLIINVVRKGLGFKRAGIFLVDPDGKHIRLAMGVDQYGRFERDKNIFLVTQRKGVNGMSDLVNGYYKYYLTNNSVKRIADRFEEENLVVYNNASVPIQVGRGRVIGILAVDNLNINRFITQSDVSSLMNYSTQVGLAIESFRSHERALAQSITDPMTGLYNRRFFDRALAQELARCVRYKRCASLIFLDIDHFKRVNDTYGHGAGDEIIKQTATLLRSSVRSLDVVARIGGEEYAILLPETPPNNVSTVVKRILRTIRETKPAHGQMETDGHRITLSLGVVTYRKGLVKPSQMVKLGDQSLYDAKHHGRNRCGRMQVISN
jgi:diguanylate cyclase (GGDEF)-like protein